MRKQILKRMWWGLALIAAASIVMMAVTLLPRTQPAAAQAAPPEEGIICTSDVSPNPTFTLTTHTGYIGLPDDNVVFMWGFSEGSSPFQHPGPVLCVNEGDTVTIILQNNLSVDTSIIFPGQDDVLANGQPAQPQFDGGGSLTSLTNMALANGGSITYSFVANHPGTFVYESGTNPGIQVQMGLFGALIVRPSAGPDHVNNRSDSKFNTEAEFMNLFSEIDPFLHQAVEQGIPFDLNDYHPRYWLINGRGFPDTIAPNFASWLPNQPYGALGRIYPYDTNEFLDPPDNTIPNPAYYPDLALERFLNVGATIIPMHPHAKNALIINRDGRPVEGQGGEDLAWENFSLPVGSGQTYDGLFKWEDVEKYNETTNPVPVTIPNLQNLVPGELYSDSPYLGGEGTPTVGHTTLNQCGEYYIISHNHALSQIVSWGVPMTGAVTFLRIDPPLPNNCQ